MKVCIPSKDRVDIMTTHLLFDPKEVLIFVEPQEIKSYRIFHPDYTFVDIQKSDQGVSYARNYILDYMGNQNFIMADDDYEVFGKRISDGHYRDLKNPKEIIVELDKNLEKYVACGIAEQTFAYYENRFNLERFHVNRHKLYDFYSIRGSWIQKHGIRYDENLKEGEDIDFTLMILIHDGTIAIDYLYSKQKKSYFINEGGLEKERKCATSNNLITLDILNRRYVDYITSKYGSEFFTISHDTYGNLITCKFRINLVFKRLDVLKKRIKNFRSETRV